MIEQKSERRWKKPSKLFLVITRFLLYLYSIKTSYFERFITDPRKKNLELRGVLKSNNKFDSRAKAPNMKGNKLVASREHKLRKQLNDNRKWRGNKVRDMWNLSRNSKQICVRIHNEFNTNIQPAIEKLNWPNVSKTIKFIDANLSYHRVVSI